MSKLHTHLACSFISSHLQADCSLVKRFVCLSLWVIQMSPSAISGHPSLTSAFIRPHLGIGKRRICKKTQNMTVTIPLKIFLQIQKKCPMWTQEFLTCSPITHWPAFIFSSSKLRVCLSAYFTPMSTFVFKPLVFAFEWKSGIIPANLNCCQSIKPSLIISIWDALNKAHHAGQGKKCGLDLSQVSILEQIICLKNVIRLQPISKNGFDEVAQVLKLQWKQ